MNSFLSSSIKQFEYYKMLADKTFGQLTFEEMQWQSQEDSNSISIIVKHMAGNMLSRWTNFLTEDGEKLWRHRDQEFIDTLSTKEDLIASWESSWACLYKAVKSLTEDDLEGIIHIRNQGHTVVEAINRQLSHYAYHVGQIVFAGKLIKGNDWESLSVHKGSSIAYNSEKFSKEKGKRHFTDDL